MATLYVGNHNYSSWSLRPWLALRWAGIPFEEKLVSLAQPGYGEGKISEILAISPNGRVPALQVDGQVIWDSLAIMEWAAEQYPEAHLWPQDWRVRALARSAVCEMHSGFTDLRNHLPMNIQRRCQVASWSPGTQRDIDRILAVWRQLRDGNSQSGPWLCGRRGLVDAFFAPVMTRFRTYGVELPADLLPPAQALFNDEDFQEWEARPITDRFEFTDGLYSKQ